MAPLKRFLLATVAKSVYGKGQKPLSARKLPCGLARFIPYLRVNTFFSIYGDLLCRQKELLMLMIFMNL